MASESASGHDSTGRIAELDSTDRGIVDALRADGRMSMRSLAELLHISRAGAYARVQRLQQDGVITGFTATIDPERCGYGLAAYVHLKVSQHSWKSVREQISAIPEVEHGALVSGQNDLVLLVRTVDAASLRDLVLNKLQGMAEVLSTQTELVFDELPRRSGGQVPAAQR